MIDPDCSTNDYRNAPSGIGPLADAWRDKPHRLVYDLCGQLELSNRLIRELFTHVDAKGHPQYDNVLVPVPDHLLRALRKLI